MNRWRRYDNKSWTVYCIIFDSYIFSAAEIRSILVHFEHFFIGCMVSADYWLADYPELRRTTQPSTIGGPLGEPRFCIFCSTVYSMCDIFAWYYRPSPYLIPRQHLEILKVASWWHQVSFWNQPVTTAPWVTAKFQLPSKLQLWSVSCAS